jgi:hypothetical protein
MFKHMVKCVPLALIALAGPLSAQAWDNPSFYSPRPGSDLGVYIFDPDGGDLGVQGIWRQQGNLSLGVRAGISDDNVLVGAELGNPLNLSGAAPLLMSWVTGVGATFGDQFTYLRVPLGISVGAQFGQRGGIQIMPYVHPRVTFDFVSIDEDIAGDDNTESELEFEVDLGADVSLTPRLTGKFGATVTNGGSVGLGLSYSLGRRVVVR